MSLEGLNAEQYRAATSEERTILCLAGAGAGKTKTLLARVEYLINQKGIDPKAILCLTFTNAAAFEMKERYKKLGIDLSKGAPEFRTFHSFCYSLIIKDKEVRARIGYSKVPELCDDKKLKEIKTAVKLQINCDLSDAELDNPVELSRKDQAKKDLFFKALKKEIKAQNVITFDIMCYNVCELFERKEPCIERYRQKYLYIMCDEFQDTDPRQYKFISSFPETTNFWLCADALQAIYGFRGCTSEFVKQLSISPGWEVIKLFQNYRSTNQICEFANKFSTYAPDDYRIEMNGQRDGDEVKVIYGSHTDYNHPVDEDHLNILIKRLQENRVESAVLCRTNKECACVRDALREAEIEFSSSNKSTDTLDILNSALDNEYLLGWLSSMLDTTEYGDYIRLSAQMENPDIHWFLQLYGKHEKIKNAATKVKQVREIVITDISTGDKFDRIVKLLKIKTKCELDRSQQLTNRQLIELVRDQLEDAEDNKIYVGTIHSSKGLEYDTVYVMGVNEYCFQLGDEEMNNLAYVAYTRAKNHLTVFRR